jgi:hypothetical protein
MLTQLTTRIPRRERLNNFRGPRARRFGVDRCREANAVYQVLPKSRGDRIARFGPAIIKLDRLSKIGPRGSHRFPGIRR